MFSSSKLVLIIIFLKALEDKQCRKLELIINYTLFILNDDSNNYFNFKIIYKKYFIYNKF